jgi:hypothetical protein
MPIIACPKCQGKLRFPEDSPPRRVKCVNCGHVFQSGPAAEPTVLESAGPRAPRSVPEDDPPPGRRDDDDDRPRRRRDRDEDDDRRSRRRDDDDRRGRRRRDDDDDDYDRRRAQSEERAREGRFDRASLACLLCFIAGWLRVGGLGVMVFVWLLIWAGLAEGINAFRVIAGLLGLGALLTAAVGYGFLISGPRDRGGLGLSIGTAAVATFHLIVLLLLATVTSHTVWVDQYAGVNWTSFITEQNAIPDVVYQMIGPFHGSPGGRALLAVFANLAEVALVILFMLTLRSLARNARDPRKAKMALHALIANAVAAGILVVASILFGLLHQTIRNDKGAGEAVLTIFRLVVYLTLAGAAVWTTLVIKSVKDGVDYRPD